MKTLTLSLALFLSAGAQLRAADCGSFVDCGNRYYTVGVSFIGPVLVGAIGAYIKCDGANQRQYSTQFEGVYKQDTNACGVAYLYLEGVPAENYGPCPTLPIGHFEPSVNTDCGRER